MKKRGDTFDKLFFLSWRKVLIVVVSGFLAVLIHNFGSALLTNLLGYEFEEPIFFIYAVVVLPIYLFTSILYSLVKIFRKEKKIPMEIIISIILGLIGSYALVTFNGWEGPWFFGFFSLVIAGVVYSLIKFLRR